MKHEIDAEKIWQLVKDWPREACPRMVFFHERSDSLNDNPFHDGVNRIENTTVYWAFVGSGLAWLADKHKQAVLWPLDPGGMCMCSYDRLPRKNESGTHHLAAVSAAVLAAAKGGA